MFNTGPPTEVSSNGFNGPVDSTPGPVHQLDPNHTQHCDDSKGNPNA